MKYSCWLLVVMLGSLGWGQICALPQPSCSSSDPAMCQKLWGEYLENCGEHWLKPSTPELPICQNEGTTIVCHFPGSSAFVSLLCEVGQVRTNDNSCMTPAPCSQSKVGEVCVKDEPKPLPTGHMAAIPVPSGQIEWPISIEPVDMPAIPTPEGQWLVRSCGPGEKPQWPPYCAEITYTCKDTSRFLLEAEDHTWHCLKFGGEK